MNAYQFPLSNFPTWTTDGRPPRGVVKGTGSDASAEAAWPAIQVLTPRRCLVSLFTTVHASERNAGEMGQAPTTHVTLSSHAYSCRSQSHFPLAEQKVCNFKTRERGEIFKWVSSRSRLGLPFKSQSSSRRPLVAITQSLAATICVQFHVHCNVKDAFHSNDPLVNNGKMQLVPKT